MSMYINTGKYLYLLSRYYGDEFSSRIDYLGLFNTLEDAREHAFYHAKAFLDLVGKVSRHTEAITVEEVANGYKIFDTNINQFVRTYTFTAVPICVSGDAEKDKDVLDYWTHDVKVTEDLKTRLQKEDMRDHCTEALKQLLFNSFREASHFWYNDVRGKIKNGIDRFIPVSLVLDMYDNQHTGYRYPELRRWYEEIFGWDRDYLVRAIENMAVIYNDHKAYAVLPMVMTTAEIEGRDDEDTEE